MKFFFRLLSVGFLLLPLLCDAAQLGRLYEQIVDRTNAVVPTVTISGLSTIGNNQLVALTAQPAVCSTCAPFYYWAASGGQFQGAANSPNVTWTPPVVNATQTYEIEVVVGDGKGRIASSVWPITVSPVINACLDGVTAPKLYVMGGWVETSYLNIEWQPISNATGYVVQESSNIGFTGASEYTTSGYSSSSLMVDNKANGTYYYRVKARNSCGDSAWSNTSSRVVQVNAPPNIPGSPSPANGAAGVGRTPALAWTGGDADGQAEYAIEFGTDPNSLGYIQGYGGANSFNATKMIDWSLSPSTTYYWRVRSQDDRGAEVLGPVWTFNTSNSSADLVPTSVIMTSTGANGNTVANGSTVQMVVVVENQGDFPSDAVVLRFYYSPYENAEDREYVGKLGSVPALQPGASTTVSIALPISDLLPGASYLVAKVDTALHADRDVSNNVISYEINYTDTQAPTISSFRFPNAVNGVLKSNSEAKFYYTVQDDLGNAFVDLSYSSDNGASWNTIVSSLPVATMAGNAYAWIVPGNVPLNNQFKVKVNARDTSGNTGSSILGPYTVIDGLPPSLSITLPQGREVWDLGSTQSIAWTLGASSIGIKQVRVSYRYANGSASQTIAILSGNPGSYSWHLPVTAAYASTEARIVLDVTDNNDNTVQVVSESFITRDNAAPPAAPWTPASKVTTVPTVVTQYTVQDNDLPVTAVDSSGHVHMAYLYSEDNSSSLIANPSSYPARILTQKLYYTKKSGGVWSAPVMIRSIVNNLDGGDLLGAKTISGLKIALGANSRVSLVWTENIESAGNLSEVYFSWFNGSTWGAPVNVSDDSKSTSFVWSTPAQPPIYSDGGWVRLAAINDDIYAMGFSYFKRLYKFDTVSNAWSQLADVSGVTSNGAQDGDIATVGGLVYAADSTGNFVAYNPSSNTWTQKAHLLTAGAGVHLAAYNGKIYAVGAGPSNTLQMFDPATNTWTYKAAMHSARSYPAITVFENKLHVIGGKNPAGQGVKTVEEYNLATDSWVVKLDTIQLSDVMGAARVAGKNYLAARDHAYMESYDGNANLWSPAGPLPAKMGSGDVVSPLNGDLYVMGATSFVRGTPGGTADPYAKVSEEPRVIIDANGLAYVFWYGACADSGVDGQTIRSRSNCSIIYRTYDAASNTWSSKSSLLSNIPNALGFVVVRDGNTLHLAHGSFDASLGHTAISYMKNSGSGWSAPTLAVIEDPGSVQELDMAISGQGDPMLLIRTVDPVSPNSLPNRLFYSARQNGAWSAPETVLRSAKEPSPSRLFVDTNNVPVALYKSRDTQSVYLTKRLSNGHWVNGISANSASQTVGNFDAAVDPTQNKLFMAYSAVVNDHVIDIFANTADLTTDIVGPAIALSGPLAGTVLSGGTTQLLSWNASDDRVTSSVALKYSTDGGSSFMTIASNLAASGSYLWTLPNVSAGNLVVYAVAGDAAGNQGTTSLPSISLAPRSLLSIVLDGPTSLSAGGSASYSLTGNYDNDTTATVTGLLMLATTPYASLNGTTLTIATGAGNQTVTLLAAYIENGVTKTTYLEIDIVLTPTIITFATAPTNLKVGETGAVGATASSGLPVTFSSLTPTVCTVSGSTVTGLAVGICTIAADQAGNSSFAAAPQIRLNFNVASGLAIQTITFGTAPTNLTVGKTATVSATASSGLPVTITSNTTGICSVSGNTVSGIASGFCTIAANQAGNSNYSPAQQVTLSFSIAAEAVPPGPPTLSSITAGSGSATLNFSASANSGGSPISSYTATCTANGQTTRSATGSGSPIAVKPLTGGVTYHCTVTATNVGGLTSVASATMLVTPISGKKNSMTPIMMLLLLD